MRTAHSRASVELKPTPLLSMLSLKQGSLIHSLHNKYNSLKYWILLNRAHNINKH
jgi:hypothetical protein